MLSSQDGSGDAAVPAALSPGRHPEEAHGQDLGEHPARAGATHLAAVPQDGGAGGTYGRLLSPSHALLDFLFREKSSSSYCQVFLRWQDRICFPPDYYIL